MAKESNNKTELQKLKAAARKQKRTAQGISSNSSYKSKNSRRLKKKSYRGQG